MNRRTLKDYKAISKMTDAEMVDTWQEITQEEAEYLRDAVPPYAENDGAFLCGEIATQSVDGSIYNLVIDLDNHYFTRPIRVTALYISLIRQRSCREQWEWEIRSMFYGVCQACGNVLDVNGFCTAPLSKAD